MKPPLRIVICEDSCEDADRLKSLIMESGIPVSIELFASGEDLLQTFKPGRYDLAFIDIYMNGLSGIKAVELIRKNDTNVVIAFATSSLDHTLDSYRLGALKYLEKPIKAEDVKEALELAEMKVRSRASISLLISGEHTDVPLDSLLYFEVKNREVWAFTSSGILKISQTVKLDDIESILPSPPFIRCHHSFFVNLCYVDSMENGDFRMANGDRVYVRRGDAVKYASVFKNFLLDEVGRDNI